jgi:hypothetical protein
MVQTAAAEPTIADTFWARVDIRGEDECWPWLGFTDTRVRCGRRYPYGFAYYWGKTRRAHRVAWVLAYGAIPPPRSGRHQVCVLHRCDNPSCMNPQHLFLGTLRDNNLDRDAKGHGNTRPATTASAVRNLALTHCLRGHRLSASNITVRKNGHRDCKTCKKWHNSKRRRGKRYTA